MGDYRSPNLFEVDKVAVGFLISWLKLSIFLRCLPFAVVFSDWWRTDKKVLGFFLAELQEPALVVYWYSISSMIWFDFSSKIRSLLFLLPPM